MMLVVISSATLAQLPGKRARALSRAERTTEGSQRLLVGAGTD
jgi:hypothetical protein